MILSLLSLRGMGGRAILQAIPYVIKRDVENSIWRDYMAKCIRIVTENTANACKGSYLKAEYSDIIHPKPEEKRTSAEIIAAISDKLNKIGGE